MDRRRSEYESYRPDYSNNQNARDSDMRFQNGRPGIPSRSNSHYSNVSRSVRSPGDTPLHSPHSPSTSHGENSSTTNTNKVSVSKDPRKTRVLPESSVSEKFNMTLNENALMGYFRELARQVSCENKMHEAEKKLKVTKEEGRVMKERFPDNNPLADQFAKSYKRDEEAFSNCLRLLTDSRDRTEKILASLPSETKTLLSGVIPNPDSVPSRDNLDNVKFAIKSLEEKVESLTKQNKEQEVELRQLRERHIRPPSEPLESRLTSKITDSQREVGSKFVTLDQRVQKCNEDMRLYEKAMDQQRDDLQKQRSEIRSLTPNQNGVTGSLASLQKRVDELETQSPGSVLKETPRSPPRDDLDDEVAEIKTQQKEQKRQIADLGNMFVSRQEYSDGFSQLEVSMKSLEKLLQEADKALQPLTSSISVLATKTSQLADDIDQVKIGMKDLSSSDPKILHERIDSLSKSTEKLQRHIDTLDKSFTEQVTARAVTHDAEVVSKLQVEVKTLSNFSGHYTTFYEKTQDALKQVNEQLAVDDDRMTRIRDELESRLESADGVRQQIKKAVVEVTERHKAKEEADVQTINEMHKRMNGLEVNATLASTQHAAVVKDIQALKVSTEQVSHSIQSLDTRYSAISTQKLYHSIVATIQPLIPQIYELKDQLQSVRNTVALSEQRAAIVNDRIKFIETGKTETMNRIKALENRTRSFPATDPTSQIGPQQDGEVMQQAQRPLAHEDSELREGIARLKNDQDGLLEQLQTLQGKLVEIDQVVTGQQQNTVDKDSVGRDLTQLCAELKQKTDEVHLKLADELIEIKDKLEGMRSEIITFEKTLSEKGEIVDRLRTEVEIVDDLQSRIQSAQTDVTTHQEHLAKLETDLSQVQDFGQRLKQLETQFEEKQIELEPLHILRAEFEQIKEGISSSGMEDIELRQRIGKIEQIVFPVAFPVEDRYVVCDNLASTVTDVMIQGHFSSCTIKEIRFGGGKIPGTNRTTRYAIVWIASSGTADSDVEKIIKTQNGRSWGGRRPMICTVPYQIFRMIWMEEPNSIKELVPNLQSLSSDRASEVASTPGPIRGVSANHTEDNTIEVARSSVLPKKSSTNPDVTELPDSDEEDLLDKFGATRDGKSSKQQLPERAGSTNPATSSTRGVSKRGAPDSGSSRPSSKRGRRG